MYSLTHYYSYFVGRFGETGNPKRLPGAEYLAIFDLAKPDPRLQWWKPDWNEDTKLWEW